MEPLVFAIPAAIYLGMPLLVKFSSGVNANPRLEPVIPAAWPLNIAQTMSRVEHDLYALGFSICARFRMPDATGNTHTMLTMFVNYKSGDKAMITAIWGQSDGAWRLGTIYSEFSTRFEDGKCFDTMNSKTIGSFQKGPMDIKTQVPDVTEAAELWALHRYVMRKHGAKGRKIVYDMKEADAYLRRIWREGFEEQVKFGRYVACGDRFVPSFKGAYLMTWALLWPMSWMRKTQMQSKANAILREWKGQGQWQNTSNESALDENSVLVKPEMQGAF